MAAQSNGMVPSFELLDVTLLDAQGRVLGSDSHLYALGPPARAAFWETTAVPDIRKRIEVLVGVLRP